MSDGFACLRSKEARRRFLIAFFLVFLGGSVSGCDNEKTRNLINDRAVEAKESLVQAGQPGTQIHYNPLTVTDKVWAGNAAMRMHRGMPLPPKYETAHGITLVSTEPMALSDIANAITSQTGVPVHVIETGASARVVTSGTASGMPIAYEGPLSGLMERVSGYFGVSWRYDGSTISVSRFETRVFSIEALPGTQTVSEGMQDDTGSSSGGSSGGSSSGGGSASQSSITQNSKFSIDIKYWDELGQVLTSMLGGTGTVVISPSLGIVTVSTTPEIMRAVADYLSQENKRLSRQIAINVEVYSVNLSEGEDFNIAFTGALGRLANFGGFQFSSAGAPSSAGGLSGLGGLSLAILNPTNVAQLGDVFQALSSIGDTTRVAQFPMTTLNNRPVSRRVGRDIAYVASSTSNNTGTTSGGTAAVGTTVTPATVHEGFSVQVTPRLLDDGRILMQYSLSLIDLEKIAVFNSESGSCGSSSSGDTSSCSGGSGSTTVQLPQTTNRIFVQQSVLRSGSMLVIGGIDEEDLGQNAQGVGSPFNFLLGGGSSNATSHTMVFIAITPQVIDLPQEEHD